MSDRTTKYFYFRQYFLGFFLYCKYHLQICSLALDIVFDIICNTNSFFFFLQTAFTAKKCGLWFVNYVSIRKSFSFPNLYSFFIPSFSVYIADFNPPGNYYVCSCLEKIMSLFDFRTDNHLSLTIYFITPLFPTDFSAGSVIFQLWVFFISANIFLCNLLIFYLRYFHINS